MRSTCSRTWFSARCLPEADVEKEKEVVLEEIKMEEDKPESLVHEVLSEDFWRGHPLGSPILGTAATVRHFCVLPCWRFSRVVCAEQYGLTAAGHITLERPVHLVQGALFSPKRAVPAGLLEVAMRTRPSRTHR